MIDFSNKDSNGTYEVIERIMISVDAKCGCVLVLYNYCGYCGTLLDKSKDMEEVFKDLKKAVFGIQ